MKTITRKIPAVATMAGMVAGSAGASAQFLPKKKPRDLPDPVSIYPVESEVHWRIKEMELWLAKRDENRREAPLEEIARLVEELGDKNYHVRQRASKALPEIGYPASPALRRAVMGGDAERRVRSERVLRTLQQRDENIAQALIHLVDHLGQKGAKAKAAVPVLIKALNVEHDDLRIAIARALRAMKTEAKSAAPALLTLMEDMDGGIVRQEFASALGEIGVAAKEAVPQLIKALQDQDFYARRAAAETLGNLGAEAKDAVPALIAALKDNNGTVRERAVLALGKMGPHSKEVLPGLIAALTDDFVGVKSEAARVISTLGKDAAPAIPELIASLKDHSLIMRAAAASALGNLGSIAKEALPALEALKDADISMGDDWYEKELKRCVVKAIGQIQGGRSR